MCYSIKLVVTCTGMTHAGRGRSSSDGRDRNKTCDRLHWLYVCQVCIPQPVYGASQHQVHTSRGTGSLGTDSKGSIHSQSCERERKERVQVLDEERRREGAELVRRSSKTGTLSVRCGRILTENMNRGPSCGPT